MSYKKKNACTDTHTLILNKQGTRTHTDAQTHAGLPMRNRSPNERLLGIVLHLIISRIVSDAERDCFEICFEALSPTRIIPSMSNFKPYLGV